MSDFKNNVLFYLRGLSEESEEDKKVCPKCGKYPCVCDKNSSASTKTAGGDDGDDYTKNASASTDKDAYFGSKVPADGYTPEEKEILKCIANKIKKQQKAGLKEPTDGWTPEEKEIISLLSKKSSVVDDHTNGANGCANTEASKDTEDVCPKCGKKPCVCDKLDKKSSLKESIINLMNY